ncbi:anti sigma factor C-terminal domain-containing protein [Tepidibacter hydrothermalis]|uniref:Anti sigma factor C-terminal domain-containing protein n=1 Tax=Tepidibacter hydrothermalis TaxID=3036126 RepID=A0ABY8E909_9FIRM|nr:anti sigma factor C-terminal domain-containing protein [Tepidibacter hydrothermalis]WFD09398.1 anti sigma factor C-terminal domain-containing protein [Tepidibacter hydrothermalis]
MNDFFDKDFEFEKVIKKSKRITNFKIIGISTIICILLIGVAYFINTQIVATIDANQSKFLQSYYKLRRPNEYIGSVKSTNGILENTLEYTTYKIINNKPIYNGTYSLKTNIFDKKSGDLGYDGGYIRNSIFVGEDKNTGGLMEYNSMGYKKMRFYHPKVKYYREPNEIKEMDNLDENSYAEVAISFNKSFSFDEAYKMIPNNLDICWYWIDNYKGDKLKEHKKFAEVGKSDYISQDGVVGVRGIDRFGKKIKANNSNKEDGTLENEFVDPYVHGLSLKYIDNKAFVDIKKDLDLEYLTKEVDLDKLYYNNEPINLNEPLEVIGVVVTGKVKDIKALEDNKNIKTSVLGYYK